MKLKIPIKYVDLLEYKSGLVLKPEIAEWFDSIDESYSLTEDLDFVKADMVIYVSINIEDDATAMQFKLRWL